jgi:hypothetical protein
MPPGPAVGSNGGGPMEASAAVKETVLRGVVLMQRRDIA